MLITCVCVFLNKYPACRDIRAPQFSSPVPHEEAWRLFTVFPYERECSSKRTLWAGLCPLHPQNSDVEVLTSVSQNVTF